jgi:VanZ family protein
MLSVRHPRLWLVIGWTLVVGCLYVSLMPVRSLPHTGVSDKIEHAGAYALLALWFAGLYPRSRYVIIGIGLFMMGVTIEWAQGAMHLGRQSDYRDVIANTIGIVAGLVLAALWLGGWAVRIDGGTRGRETITPD